MQPLYVAFAIPALINLWQSLPRTPVARKVEWFNLFAGSIGAFSAGICLVPISQSEETDYLTLGITLMVLNFGLIAMRRVLRQEAPIVARRRIQLVHLVFVVAAGLAVYLRAKN